MRPVVDEDLSPIAAKSCRPRSGRCNSNCRTSRGRIARATTWLAGALDRVRAATAAVRRYRTLRSDAPAAVEIWAMMYGPPAVQRIQDIDGGRRTIATRRASAAAGG